MKPRISLNPKTQQLYIQWGQTSQHTYRIDLKRCVTSAGLVDWLFQIMHKAWCTPQIMHTVMLALDELTGMQSTFGHRRRSRFDWADSIDAYYRNLNETSDDPAWDKKRMQLIKSGMRKRAAWGLSEDSSTPFDNARELDYAFAPKIYIRRRTRADL